MFSKSGFTMNKIGIIYTINFKVLNYTNFLMLQQNDQKMVIITNLKIIIIVIHYLYQ